MLNLKATVLVLAVEFASPKPPGDPVTVDNPFPVFIAVPAKPVTCGLLLKDVQVEEPFEPSR